MTEKEGLVHGLGAHDSQLLGDNTRELSPWQLPLLSQPHGPPHLEVHECLLPEAPGCSSVSLGLALVPAQDSST